uniref:Uncharacterized protein n=1 Tax=viral metagenome TaxID=1070528 RepID=A0A6C0BVM7_9ZZZZ
MIDTIYIGVATAIFTGGCAFFKKEVNQVMPVLVIISLAWPIIIANNIVCLISKSLKKLI